MTAVFKPAPFQRTATWLAMLLILSLALLPAQLVGAFQPPTEASQSSPNAIPLTKSAPRPISSQTPATSVSKRPPPAPSCAPTSKT